MNTSKNSRNRRSDTKIKEDYAAALSMLHDGKTDFEIMDALKLTQSQLNNHIVDMVRAGEVLSRKSNYITLRAKSLPISLRKLLEVVGDKKDESTIKVEGGGGTVMLTVLSSPSVCTHEGTAAEA